LEELNTIIKGAMQNDRRCQKSIYERYFRYALKVVFRYIYRHETAVDVVNDGFVKLFRHFSRFEYPHSADAEKILLGWIRKIMVNSAIDRLRQDKFTPETDSLPDHVWQISDDGGEPDQQLKYKELIMHIKTLPPAYRAVFNMYVIDGYTHREIAETLGISEGTSKSNLAKARLQLQKKLKNEEPENKTSITKNT
jgi:RNA polymerase sigma-70 factor (ECF subfamily)